MTTSWAQQGHITRGLAVNELGLLGDCEALVWSAELDDIVSVFFVGQCEKPQNARVTRGLEGTCTSPVCLIPRHFAICRGDGKPSEEQLEWNLRAWSCPHQLAACHTLLPLVTRSGDP